MPKQKQDTIKINWTKNCPECGKLQKYKTEYYLKECIKRNTRCNSCANRNNNIGHKHSKQSKQKMSKSTSGKNNPMYGNGNLIKGKNNPMYGRTHTEKTKEKMKLKATNRLHSEETKKKISDASQHLTGENNGMYNKNILQKH